MEDEYIYFSEEDGNKLIDLYADHLGKGYFDRKNGKIYSIEIIVLMPANPRDRNEIWRMMLDFYNGGSATIENIEQYMKQLRETEFSVSLISKESGQLIRPEYQMHHLHYVVTDTGDLALGFGLD